MANSITWSKEIRAAAKERTQGGLFAVGFENSKLVGRATGPCDPDKAEKMFRFCMEIHHGKDPHDTFKEIYGWK